jgi:hypothetical protein
MNQQEPIPDTLLTAAAPTFPLLRPVAVVALLDDMTSRETARQLTTYGFDVSRLRSRWEVLDLFADVLLGESARPNLLIIDSRLDGGRRAWLTLTLRQLRWHIPTLVYYRSYLIVPLLSDLGIQTLGDGAQPADIASAAIMQWNTMGYPSSRPERLEVIRSYRDWVSQLDQPGPARRP